MPTYEYICSACGHAFELFESITAKPSKDCPSCKKKKAVRQISGGAGLIFKGTGFYVTDYKKKSGGDSKPSESAAKSDTPATTTTAATSTSSETKSESKPVAASTPAPAPKTEPTTRTSKPVTKKK